MAKDYYDTLGVARDATAEDIKRAYRRLAREHHPDRTGGSDEKFKEINAAYQVLGDSSKRAQYDRFGAAEGMPGGGAGGFGFEGVNVDFQDINGFGDIFDQFFGGGRRSRPSVRRGSDASVDITISFEESAVAQRRDIAVRLYQSCSHCRGSGAEPGTPIKECPACRGSGVVREDQQTMFGVFQRTAVCGQCRGDGKIAQKPCTHCRGEGREMSDRTYEVVIPAGIADDQAIQLAGKGEAPPRGGLAGDLYVTVHVRPHPALKRKGDNVEYLAQVSFADAALGAATVMPTLNGEEKLTIPAGTQPGARLTLSGRGFPHLRGSGRGDQIVTVSVEIPRRLSREQRSLLEQFRTAKKKKGLLF